MSSRPGPSRATEDIRRFRQEHRDAFNQAAVNNPALFVPMDKPLQGLAPAQIDQAMQRLERIAGAEGSAIEGTDWRSEIDSDISLEANEEHLISIGGRLPLDERREGRMSGAEADEIQESQATNEILDMCEAIDDAGADGAGVLESVFRGDTDSATTALEDTGIDVSDVSGVLDDIDEAFGGVVVSNAIAECRDRLGGPDIQTMTAEDVLLELRDRFDLGQIPPEDVIEVLGGELERRAEPTGEPSDAEAAVNRLSRAFGVRFESLDDAVQSLQERIAQARGERLRIATIEARRSGGDVLVRIDDGAEFDEHLSLARRRVRRGIGFGPEEPRAWTDVGEIHIRGEELELVDLERGIEQYGMPDDTDVPVREEFEVEQADLPVEPAEPGDNVADRAIRLLEET